MEDSFQPAHCASVLKCKVLIPKSWFDMFVSK